MLAELDNAGFSPPFNYQLLPLAPKGAWARTWIMNDLGRPGGGEIRYKIDEEGDRFSDEEGESEISFAERDVSPSVQDDEDEEIEYSDGRRLRTGVGKRQWKMPRKGNPKKSSYDRGLREERQPLRNPEGNSKKHLAKRVKGSMEKWPPQFNPQTFKRTTAIFEVKKPLFAELTTKVELKQACRDHGIKKFTWWSEGPKDLFRWWMEQEMAEREAVGEEGEKTAIRSRKPKIAVHNKSARMTRNATRKAETKKGPRGKRESVDQYEEQKQPRKKTKSVAARVEQKPKAARRQTAKESLGKENENYKS
ncbi:hypothetical protein B0O99DRAFT_98426 [Bisporella sp. PMI_857]|nr:hypothetical protein B0O99DRAFT_98426 [Bisporella sp. PMI_857]